MSERMKNDWNHYKIGIGAALAYLFFFTVFLGDTCPTKIFFHKSCPGCGLTRAAVYLVTFRWQEAWSMNAMIFPLTIFLVWCFFFRYMKGKKVPFVYGGTALLCIGAVIYHIARSLEGKI